jgi:hypothetical protein
MYLGFVKDESAVTVEVSFLHLITHVERRDLNVVIKINCPILLACNKNAIFSTLIKYFIQLVLAAQNKAMFEESQCGISGTKCVRDCHSQVT